MNKKCEEALISVVVPIYNTEKYLDACLKSIRAQTYGNLQIILVDDGSTDHSFEICQKYVDTDPRFELVRKTNGGLSSARNAGLDRARGLYIGFVDSDDYIKNTMYENLLEIITPDHIASTGVVRVDEDETVFPDCIQGKEEQSGEDFIRDLLLYTGDSSVCTKLFPRHAFDGLRFDEGVLNEDFKLMILAAEKVSAIRYTKSCDYYYRIRKGSITSSFGKATEDSVSNALWAKEYIARNYPSLKREADSFSLYQHMIYLLTIPRELIKDSNPLYRNVIAYIRKNAIKDGLLTGFYGRLAKMVVLTQTICPTIPSRLYYRLKRKERW